MEARCLYLLYTFAVVIQLRLATIVCTVNSHNAPQSCAKLTLFQARVGVLNKSILAHVFTYVEC